MGYLEYATCEEAARRIARLGYEAIDFWAYSPHLGPDLYDKMDRANIRKLVDDLHLEVSGLSVNAGALGLHLNLSHPNPKVRRDTVEYYTACVELASDVGAPLVNICSGMRVYGVTFEEAWNWNREAIEEILAAAEEKDILIGLHTLTPCESNVIVTLEDTLRMTGEIGSDRLRLIIDTADQNVTEPNLYSAVKKAGSKLGYVHVNDNMGEKRGDVHLPPGRGNINWTHFFRTLKEVGYDGYVLVQIHSIGYPVDIDGWAFESKQYLDRVLAEFES
jgi:sugar phosphate isomerase/epimerase